MAHGGEAMRDPPWDADGVASRAVAIGGQGKFPIASLAFFFISSGTSNGESLVLIEMRCTVSQ